MTPSRSGCPADLAEGVVCGDRLALARAITCLETRGPAALALLALLYPRGGRAHVVGVTGAPGTGKSTLVNVLASTYRRRGLTVGILAVDPSSPYTGGAFPGDRLRLRDLAGDPGVFIRSMATRGAMGGLSPVAADVVHALDAAGYARIMIETVGAGQDQVQVASLAHTVIVVEAPGLGDDIQAIKAGMLETASILVVNKADRDGVGQTLAALRLMLELRAATAPVSGHHGPAPPPEARSPANLWQPPLLPTVATEGRGLAEVVDAIERHREHLSTTGEVAGLETRRAEAQLKQAIDEALRHLLAERTDPAAYGRALSQVVERTVDPQTAARQLVSRLTGSADDLPQQPPAPDTRSGP